MRVLVAGGAGFIGSHTVVKLVEAGHEPIIVDNFSNSKPIVINRLEQLTGTSLTWYRADLTERELTEQIFVKEKPDAVIHFAGLKAVGESVEKPLWYYETNLNATFNLLHGMAKAGTRVIVFSSSATVYGNNPIPFQEDMEAVNSLSPYGYSKVAIERILSDTAKVTDIQVGLLRYFNPVGAHTSGTIGEDPLGIPNNLMPAIAAVATGRREKLFVFGTDYPTPDGTCLRDYIHVDDLAAGHVAALDYLAAHETKVRAWNFGTGQGTSVLELIHAFEKASGLTLPVEYAPRRDGDRDAFWADASRAKTELGWSAEKSIDEMCEDTWRFQSANPAGYPDDEPESRSSNSLL
ncbi:UDP-glucose 4-epimerase GalE [Arcanobacterium canis]